MRVREPTADRNGVLRVEYVRCGRVIDDDCVLEISSYLGKILFICVNRARPGATKWTHFDVVALMVIATFTEQAMMHNPVYV